jgi:hypothetical protein
MTYAHSLDSLSVYLVNAQKMTDLEAQIKHKEAELRSLEQLEEIYADLGAESMLDAVAKRENDATVELLKLQLQRNSVEREMLLFELMAVVEE